MENKYGLKVGMLILLEPDIEAAVSFYEQLGFKKNFHLKGQWAEFMLGDVKIGLCPTAQQLPDHHTGIVLEVSDLRKIYNELKQLGISFMSEPKEPEHGIMVSIKDPGNNVLDLYQPTLEKIKNLVKKVKEKDEICCGGNSCNKAEC